MSVIIYNLIECIKNNLKILIIIEWLKKVVWNLFTRKVWIELHEIMEEFCIWKISKVSLIITWKINGKCKDSEEIKRKQGKYFRHEKKKNDNNLLRSIDILSEEK